MKQETLVFSVATLLIHNEFAALSSTLLRSTQHPSGNGADEAVHHFLSAVASASASTMIRHSMVIYVLSGLVGRSAGMGTQSIVSVTDHSASLLSPHNDHSGIPS